MRVPNAWRAFSAARRYERLSQHPTRNWIKWVRHRASWKSLESFIQLISICNSWILPVSSRYLDLRPIFSSKLYRMPNLEIASILPSHWDFSHELHEDPDFVPKIVHEEVADLVEAVRLLDEHDQFLLFETLSFHSKFEYFWHNRPWNSCFRSSAWQSARICSHCRSRRILICSFSESRHGFSLTLEMSDPNSSETGLLVLTWPTDNDWLDN